MSILFKLFVQSWFGSHHCLERTSLPVLKKEICNFSQTKSWPISPTNRSPFFNQQIAAKGGEILEVGSEWWTSYPSMEYTLTCMTYICWSLAMEKSGYVFKNWISLAMVHATLPCIKKFSFFFCLGPLTKPPPPRKKGLIFGPIKGNH